ncbi:MAG: 50S ribosomal protein L36 [Rickettsiales bacterium]|jgi:large subunit ribosomal protein L36|nr:50S ribosomal protein L36 [Rickettsiales bacterium]
MKIVGSIKNLKKRDKNCKVVRRKKMKGDGKGLKSVLVIINKKNPRFKASQG